MNEIRSVLITHTLLFQLFETQNITFYFKVDYLKQFKCNPYLNKCKFGIFN